ncbi:unnamed protein product [Closterium sp. NIES-65]|nr:unnamed protein product [Closterium sp. NIES-65]
MTHSVVMEREVREVVMGGEEGCSSRVREVRDSAGEDVSKTAEVAAAEEETAEGAAAEGAAAEGAAAEAAAAQAAAEGEWFECCMSRRQHLQSLLTAVCPWRATMWSEL